MTVVFMFTAERNFSNRSTNVGPLDRLEQEYRSFAERSATPHHGE
jgi:hypothetical protein